LPYYASVLASIRAALGGKVWSPVTFPFVFDEVTIIWDKWDFDGTLLATVTTSVAWP
jgi:hypothetical protein